MPENTVVGPDLMPDQLQLKKLGEVLAEITRQFVEGLYGSGKGLSLEQGQMFAEHRVFPEKMLTQVNDAVNGGISPYLHTVTVIEPELLIADWQEFYRQVHSMDMTPLFDRQPPVVPGFNWGVWVPKGMTPQRAYEMGESMYPSLKWCLGQSLDEVIDFTQELCTVTKQYLVWCQDSVEAPSTNPSVLQIAPLQFNTMTLIEVELLHQWFFWKSGGQHLDIKHTTLCTGSRYSGGLIPTVRWDSYYNNLNVGKRSVGGVSNVLDVRSRQAVS